MPHLPKQVNRIKAGEEESWGIKCKVPALISGESCLSLGQFFYVDKTESFEEMISEQTNQRFHKCFQPSVKGNPLLPNTIIGFIVLNIFNNTFHIKVKIYLYPVKQLTKPAEETLLRNIDMRHTYDLKSLEIKSNINYLSNFREYLSDYGSQV